MWSVAVVKSTFEFQVKTALNDAELDAFLPYTLEKQVVTVTPPRTTANPRPRALHKVEYKQIARWPGYLFCRTNDINLVLGVRNVSAVVRSAEGEPATLTDTAMAELRRGCAPDGRVLKRSELHGFSIGDLLGFVQGSSFAGHSAQVNSIESDGRVRVTIDGRVRAYVDHKELTSAIS